MLQYYIIWYQSINPLNFAAMNSGTTSTKTIEQFCNINRSSGFLASMQMANVTDSISIWNHEVNQSQFQLTELSFTSMRAHDEVSCLKAQAGFDRTTHNLLITSPTRCHLTNSVSLRAKDQVKQIDSFVLSQWTGWRWCDKHVCR